MSGMLVPAAPALGATIFPTRADDPAGPGTCPGDCSLREAIAAANPGDTISLAPPAQPGPYTLTQGALLVSKPLTIAGVDARSSAITSASTTIIQNMGTTVTLSGVDLTGVAAPAFVVNTGGNGTVNLIDSSVEGNPGASGFIQAGGTLRIVNSTVANNGGFGVSAAGTTLAVSNSTIAGNNGEGLTLAGDTTTLASATIAYNGNGSGPGNLNDNGGGSLTIRNSIVAQGRGAAGMENCSISSVTESATYSMEDMNQCGFSGLGSRPNTNPMLLGLANYGGPTDTVAVSALSPAVDAADPSGCTDASGSPLGTDQRGAVRGDRCDIGAFEYLQPPTNTAPPTVSGSAREGSSVTCQIGSWSGGMPLSFSIQWLQDGSAINGATGSMYAIPTGAAHHLLSCRATARNFTAIAAATSAPVTVAGAPATPTKANITRLHLSHSKFALAGTRTHLPRGTVFSFQLDVSATVEIVVQTTGCKPGTQTRVGVARCVTFGKLIRAGHAGLNEVQFTGRLQGKALKASRYQAVFKAIDAAGASSPKRLRFTILAI